MNEGDFKSVRALIDKVLGQKGEYFVTGKVIKRDVPNKLVWLAEFGDQPIPLVGYDYQINYYDTTSTGAVVPKKAIASPMLPKIGQTVVVARELGSRRLPRLLGVLQGINWISTEED